MRTTIRAAIFARIFSIVGLVFLGVSLAFAQERALQTEGWQGPKPTIPKQETIIPAPQRPVVPSGKQVLEIPVQPQRPAVPSPRQQASIPPRPQ